MQDDTVKQDFHDETKRWWTESLGRIEFHMTKEQAESVPLSCQQGTADIPCLNLSKNKDIREQLDKYTPELLIECLLEFGCWGLEELKNHEENIQRLLWIAACDIQEQEEEDD